MKHMTLTLLAAGLVIGLAGEAAAQGADSRAYLGVNFGGQGGSDTIGTVNTFDLYGEQGTVTFGTETKGGPMFDLSGGFKVAGQFSVGLGYSRVSSESDGAIAGVAPHPIFFNRPRSFTGTASGLDRSEQMLHISLGYTLAMGDNLSLMIYGGPSMIRLSQEVVSNVSVSEVGAPFTSVNSTATVSKEQETAWGGHIGADASYFFTERIGAGAFVRYVGASADVSKVGGAQFGGGLRFRF